LSQETPKFTLPFSIPSQNRHEKISDETEKAAVWCLSELERKKGGGIVTRQAPERVNFITKTCYPLWIVPFHEVNLILDGLNKTAHTLSHPMIRDLPDFMDGAERSSSSREAYAAFLSENINYFQVSDKKEDRKTIEGLITDTEFLKDFNTYLSKEEPFETSTDLLVLPSVIDETSISSVLDELENLKASFTDEINDLSKIMKLLNTTTKGFARAIQSEIKATREAFNDELKKHRGPVEEKVREIRGKCDEQITNTSKEFEKELLRLQKERVKREKTRDQITVRIANSEAEIKANAKSKNAAGERKWKEQREKLKKELAAVESEIKRVEKETKETEDKKTLEIITIKSECNTQVLEASKELMEIESSRDAKIRLLQQETNKMAELTSTIIKQADATAKLREAAITALDNLGIPQKHKQQSLIYLPFYLVCFRSEARNRYLIVPPSTVNSVKLLVKLKGALGRAKIKQLLSPQSDAIASFLSRLPSIMEQNAVFEREIGQAGARVDLLRRDDANEQILRGLEQLKTEGWFSEKEYETFTQKLA
jgi:hypothetical protein